MTDQAIKTFSMGLPRPAGPFEVHALERDIAAQLPDMKRLLRWAIVRYDAKVITIEGAYLSLC